jgi:hypothetical protein
MSRYLVERTFPANVTLPGPGQTAQARLDFVENNSLDGVTWLHSYVSFENKMCYCIYDAPSPEAIRHAARRNSIPINRILEVAVLDPYFFQ